MTEAPGVGDGFAGRGPLRRHLRLIAAQLRISVLAALEYRTGFWSQGLLGLAWSIGGVIPLWVALEHRPDVAGWGPWELAMLTGCYILLAGVFAGFVQPALYAAMEHIRAGTLDYLLLRPVDALVSALVSAFEPWSCVEIIAGLVVLVVAAIGAGGSPGPIELLMALCVFVSGLLALYALAVLILGLSFRALQLQNLAFLMEALLDFARWPISVFRGPLKALFTFIIPFAIMTSYPPQALLGRLAWSSALTALATAVVLALLARGVWLRALRSYTSASS